MDHQSELEKTKYRNWVRGGLAYKYLKGGIECFVEEIVQLEHRRILSDIKHTPGLTCNRCSIQALKPLHKSEKHPNTAGKDICPKGQTKCNCLFPKKQKCPNKYCDAIFEDILRSHGSTPPSPNWKNTNIQNWCSMPWEIAKCFINAPGYSDKVSASDTDISGLLHVLINNINLHEHFSVNIDGNDIFNKAIEGRNTICHSPAMELEDDKVNEYIDNIIAILEDEKELKSKEDSKLAVVKLKQLKDRKFIITTVDEVEVCRDAMASTKQRLTQVEEKVGVLEDARNICHKQLDYLKRKQEFKKNLVTLYENHYVKTWISPFNFRDKDVNINEVYVTPNMIVKEEAGENVGEPSTMENECVKQVQNVGIGMESKTNRSRKNTENIRVIYKYQDIFQTNDIAHKKIYIIGDVGTGKSVLGKMMILNWCKACKALKDEDEDVELMRKFDFLFFIPLQRMSGFSYDIKEMTKTYFKDITSEELIEMIFEQDGERCLIIADGLDEWTPPKKTTLLPHHVSFGIPNGDGIRNATFITLSRSSAKGILNMKSTEFDQKIALLGIKPVSKIEFTRKYMSKLNKNEDTFLNEFMKKIEKSNLQHLEQTPFLLQQLIWIYCNGNRVGQSVSDIFSNILNIIFNWREGKDEEQRSVEVKAEDNTTETPEEFKQMQLPKMLRSFPRCQTNERLIFLLSKISFVALTDEIIGRTFGRLELLRFGIKTADIAIFLKLGILVEYNTFDTTYEPTYISFVHTSYLEFFAAVYIASHCTEQRNLGNTILKKLFIKFKSAVDILQLSNLLKMVCGLSPFLTGEISELISSNVRKDESMMEYRNNLHRIYDLEVYVNPKMSSLWHLKETAQQIQHLLHNCLSECGPDGPTEISLCDIIIENYQSALIQNYTPYNVISLTMSIEALPAENVVLKSIAQFSQLESICVYRGVFSTFYFYEKERQLASLLAEINMNVKSLFLINNTYGVERILQSHIFDLSKFNQLQRIHLRNVWCKIGSGVNNLKSVYCSIRLAEHVAHQVRKQFSSSLTQALKQAVFLRHLTLENKNKCFNFENILDLSKLSQLQSIRLSWFLCTFGSNVTNLETVYISGLYSTNDFFEQLSSSLGKAISLRHLSLDGKQFNDAACKGHTIDLSAHVQLQSIEFVNCTFILNNAQAAKNLEKFAHICYKSESKDHGPERLLLESLSQAVSLKHLKLEYSQFCKGRTVDLSQNDQLQLIQFSGDFSLSGLSTKSLEKVIVDSFSDVDNFIYLCSGSKLKELEIGYTSYTPGIEIFTSRTNSLIQNLQHLESLKVNDLYIDDENALTVSPRMQNINHITLCRVRMSLQAWQKFLDSLLTLKQSVRVSYMYFDIDNDTIFRHVALEYVTKNAPVFTVNIERTLMFEVTKQ